MPPRLLVPRGFYHVGLLLLESVLLSGTRGNLTAKTKNWGVAVTFSASLPPQSFSPLLWGRPSEQLANLVPWLGCHHDKAHHLGLESSPDSL